MAWDKVSKIAWRAGFSLPDVRAAIYRLSKITGDRVTTEQTVGAYASVARYVGARSLSQFVEQVTSPQH